MRRKWMGVSMSAKARNESGRPWSQMSARCKKHNGYNLVINRGNMLGVVITTTDF